MSQGMFKEFLRDMDNLITSLSIARVSQTLGKNKDFTSPSHIQPTMFALRRQNNATFWLVCEWHVSQHRPLIGGPKYSKSLFTQAAWTELNSKDLHSWLWNFNDQRDKWAVYWTQLLNVYGMAYYLFAEIRKPVRRPSWMSARTQLTNWILLDSLYYPAVNKNLVCGTEQGALNCMHEW